MFLTFHAGVIVAHSLTLRRLQQTTISKIIVIINFFQTAYNTQHLSLMMSLDSFFFKYLDLFMYGLFIFVF